ncbi:alpha-amylase [Panacibacter sp. DH6]|uniref:Alpha-amylase n=1 Tax=Panacibacter microcysteis TaxID=2793269 RepID=A0A931E232_9BACT|nr:alpha-amylase [Panacibacter microcysteis]MBG9375663.1 alpha-amylase [Panacibacter microcysteis]
MQNGTMLQFFHWYYPEDGSLWNKLKEEAKSLSELGITAIWIPPASKGTTGGYSVGYDVYDLYDLGEFDQKGTVKTKYGSKDELVNAVNAVHEAGIKVYADIVVNHLGGADEEERITVRRVNPDNRNEFTSEPFEINAYTKFTYPNRKGKYSNFVWDHQCFTGTDYASDLDETGIFSIQNEYGEGWEEVVDDEKGNYDYLMFTDVEFRNEAVREELKKWGKWYFDTLHFDGVRLDAVKHIAPQFYNEWLDYMRAEVKEDLFAVGEYWAPGYLHLLERYIDATEGRMSLFDAPLHRNLHTASKEGKDFDLRTIFDETLVAKNPGLAVTIVENHDTQPLQALEAPVEPWFKPIAYAIILLRKDGYPCIFYTDLYGASYVDKGNDGNDHEIFLPKCDDLENLLKARANYAYGEQRDYFDHGNCVGWTREGDEEHGGCAVVLSNGDEGFKSMEIGKRYAGKTFIDMLGKHAAEVTINEDGWGEFYTNAGSVCVWIEKPE